MKWFCEHCDHDFDEPRWLISGSLISGYEEIPLCPKCDSMNIDLNLNPENLKSSEVKTQ